MLFEGNSLTEVLRQKKNTRGLKHSGTLEIKNTKTKASNTEQIDLKNPTPGASRVSVSKKRKSSSGSAVATALNCNLLAPSGRVERNSSLSDLSLVCTPELVEAEIISSPEFSLSPGGRRILRSRRPSERVQSLLLLSVKKMLLDVLGALDSGRGESPRKR